MMAAKLREITVKNISESWEEVEASCQCASVFCWHLSPVWNREVFKALHHLYD